TKGCGYFLYGYHRCLSGDAVCGWPLVPRRGSSLCEFPGVVRRDIVLRRDKQRGCLARYQISLQAVQPFCRFSFLLYLKLQLASFFYFKTYKVCLIINVGFLNKTL